MRISIDGAEKDKLEFYGRYLGLKSETIVNFAILNGLRNFCAGLHILPKTKGPINADSIEVTVPKILKTLTWDAEKIMGCKRNSLIRSFISIELENIQKSFKIPKEENIAAGNDKASEFFPRGLNVSPNIEAEVNHMANRLEISNKQLANYFFYLGYWTFKEREWSFHPDKDVKIRELAEKYKVNKTIVYNLFAIFESAINKEGIKYIDDYLFEEETKNQDLAEKR